jgi:hypothetical protein
VPQHCLVIQNLLASAGDLQNIDQTMVFHMNNSTPRCFQMSFPQQLLYSTQCLPGCLVASPHVVPPSALAYTTLTPPGAGLPSAAGIFCRHLLQLLQLPCKRRGYLPGVREPSLNGCGAPLPVHIRFGGA